MAQAKASGDHEANQAAEYVAKGIDYGVAVIAEGGRLRAVALDNEVGIFKNFPESLYRDGQGQLPVSEVRARTVRVG